MNTQYNKGLDILYKYLPIVGPVKSNYHLVTVLLLCRWIIIYLCKPPHIFNRVIHAICSMRLYKKFRLFYGDDVRFTRLPHNVSFLSLVFIKIGYTISDNPITLTINVSFDQSTNFHIKISSKNIMKYYHYKRCFMFHVFS